MYCQKCRTPLRLDGSLENLNPASFKILTDSAPIVKPQAPEPPKALAAKERRSHYAEVSQHATSPQHKRNVPAPVKSSTPVNPAMSFVMLSQSQVDTFPPEEQKSPLERSSKQQSSPKKDEDITPLSQQMERNLRLFEILSSRSDIDHPVCSECTELLLAGLEDRQKSVNKERDTYVQFLKQAQEDIPTEEEQQRARRALSEAREKEKKAMEELEALEAAKAAMEEEIAALDDEAAALCEEEEAFWRERNTFDLTLNKFKEERDSLQTQFAQDSKLLESLQRTNVYNDSFCIAHDGYFGTINGLRLGRLPDHTVEWPEINAAWGQTVLLLSVVAEKLAFAFEGYALVPLGSASKIHRLEYPQGTSTSEQSRSAKPKVTQLELFCTGDLPLGLGFLHRGFDNAMVAFLECLRQLGEHVERTSSHPSNGGLASGYKLPYKINKDKIGDAKGEASIKLGAFNQEEMWTRACKYTLTCCKFLLAHASHIDDLKASGKGPH